MVKPYDLRLACGSDEKGRRLVEEALDELVRNHGTSSGVLLGFVDQVVKRLLPEIHQGHCRDVVAELVRDELMKYDGANLPEPKQTNWPKRNFIVGVAAFIVAVVAIVVMIILYLG